MAVERAGREKKQERDPRICKGVEMICNSITHQSLRFLKLRFASVIELFNLYSATISGKSLSFV